MQTVCDRFVEFYNEFTLRNADDPENTEEYSIITTAKFWLIINLQHVVKMRIAFDGNIYSPSGKVVRGNICDPDCMLTYDRYGIIVTKRARLSRLLQLTEKYC
jgi:hypothetical protein